MSDRVNYINVAEIFDINPGLIDRTEIVKLELDESYQDPFNILITIHDVYKYPEKVKEYVESLTYTNSLEIVHAAPVVRSYGPISNHLSNELPPVLSTVYNRYFQTYPMRSTIGTFSYHSPQSIDYHLHHEGHFDRDPWLPQKILAGIIQLDDSFGTEILQYNNKHVHSMPSNSAYYPEGNMSHMKSVAVTTGGFNSISCYYSDILHRPYYAGATVGCKKRGRLVQNVFFDDVTESYIEKVRAEAYGELDNAISKILKFDSLYQNMVVASPKIYRTDDPLIEEWLTKKRKEGHYDISLKDHKE